jgi:predicted Zn-ribbon and HTH transcriptional regulator
MKLSRAAKQGIAALGLVLLLCIGLVVFAASGSKKSTAIVDPTKCEYCGGKLNKSGECPKCIAELGRANYEAKRESKNWYNSPAIAATVIAILGSLVVIHIGLTLRKFSKREKVEMYHHVHCNKCGRKLRYRESQINCMGKCPLCHKPMLFPKPPEAVKEPRFRGAWRKIRQIVWD